MWIIQRILNVHQPLFHNRMQWDKIKIGDTLTALFVLLPVFGVCFTHIHQVLLYRFYVLVTHLRQLALHVCIHNGHTSVSVDLLVALHKKFQHIGINIRSDRLKETIQLRRSVLIRCQPVLAG